MLGEDIWHVHLEGSWKIETILQALNATFITLILKEESARYVNEFQLISLFTIVYNIIAKVIANKLKPLLNKIISMEQGGVVGGEKIIDGRMLTKKLSLPLKI
jgi:hypothetical protein